MNGILCPSEKLHVIKMKFKGHVPQNDRCAQSWGTFVLCKDVYNARKVIKTAWDKETNTLTVIIDSTKEQVRPVQFSFSVQIDNCVKTGEIYNRNIDCYGDFKCLANDGYSLFFILPKLIFFFL